MARWRRRPGVAVPGWVTATRVPAGWPGGYAGWRAAVDAWFDAHPEAFGLELALLSVPIDTREHDGQVA